MPHCGATMNISHGGLPTLRLSAPKRSMPGHVFLAGAAACFLTNRKELINKRPYCTPCQILYKLRSSICACEKGINIA